MEEEEEEVVFTRDNRVGSAQHATRATPTSGVGRGLRDIRKEQEFDAA